MTKNIREIEKKKGGNIKRKAGTHKSFFQSRTIIVIPTVTNQHKTPVYPAARTTWGSLGTSACATKST